MIGPVEECGRRFQPRRTILQDVEVHLQVKTVMGFPHCWSDMSMIGVGVNVPVYPGARVQTLQKKYHAWLHGTQRSEDE